jgi:hypothetical protein
VNGDTRSLVRQSKYSIRIYLHNTSHWLKRECDFAVRYSWSVEGDRCEVICDRRWWHTYHRHEREKLYADSRVSEHLSLE